MASGILRRVACVGAILGLGVASSPGIQGASAASAAPVAAAAVNSTHATSPTAVASAQRPVATGRGWGSMIACAACVVGAGLVVAGGPTTIVIAVNAPGSAIAVTACVAACYEAFQ